MTGGAKAAIAGAVALALAAAGGGGYYAYRKASAKRKTPSKSQSASVPKPTALTNASYTLTSGGQNRIETQIMGGTATTVFLVEAAFTHKGPTAAGVYKGYVQVKETTTGNQDLDAQYQGEYKATHRAEYEFTLYSVPESEGGGFKSDKQLVPFETFLGEGVASGRGVKTTQPEQMLGDCVVWFRINGDPGGPFDKVKPVVTKAAMEIETVGLFDAKLSRSVTPN